MNRDRNQNDSAASDAGPALFGWPDRRELLGVLGLSLCFGLIFLFFYGGASFISGFIPWRIRVDFAFESIIPFIPAASLVYLSMDLLVGLGPFIFRDWRKLFPLFVTLTAQTVIAAVCFILLPVETNFPERIVEGVHGTSFAIADLMNLERNFLPSLHVGFSVTAALAFGERVRLPGKIFFGLWAGAIALSTMLIHEHHILDLVAGAGLAYAMWITVGRRYKQHAALIGVDADWICLRDFVAFTRRHIRYGLIALGLLQASIPRWRERRILRTGFCFLQVVDDLLDGDRKSAREPLEVVDDLIVLLEAPDDQHQRDLNADDHFRDDPLIRLARVFRRDLLAAADSSALGDAIKLMRIMQTDRRRVLEGRLMSASELREHQRLTFYYSIDLMLTAAGAEVRAADVPDLIASFGWCSTVRDLREDLDAGLINIPRDVIEAARQAGATIDYNSLVQTAAVQAWKDSELVRARAQLDRTDARLAELQGRSGAAVLAMFARSIRKYTRP